MKEYVSDVYAQYYFTDGGTQSKTYGDQDEIANINEYVIYLDAIEVSRVKF